MDMLILLTNCRYHSCFQQCIALRNGRVIVQWFEEKGGKSVVSDVDPGATTKALGPPWWPMLHHNPACRRDCIVSQSNGVAGLLFLAVWLARRDVLAAQQS